MLLISEATPEVLAITGSPHNTICPFLLGYSQNESLALPVAHVCVRETKQGHP